MLDKVVTPIKRTSSRTSKTYIQQYSWCRLKSLQLPFDSHHKVRILISYIYNPLLFLPYLFIHHTLDLSQLNLLCMVSSSPSSSYITSSFSFLSYILATCSLDRCNCVRHSINWLDPSNFGWANCWEYGCCFCGGASPRHILQFWAAWFCKWILQFHKA